MTCKETSRWIMAAEKPEMPPLAVREHLRDCRRCCARQRRIMQLDQEMRQLPFPKESSTVRARFLHNLRKQRPVTPGTRARPAAFWYGVGYVAAIILVSSGLSWLLLAGASEKKPEKQSAIPANLQVDAGQDLLTAKPLQCEEKSAKAMMANDPPMEHADPEADVRGISLLAFSINAGVTNQRSLAFVRELREELERGDDWGTFPDDLGPEPVHDTSEIHSADGTLSLPAASPPEPGVSFVMSFSVRPGVTRQQAVEFLRELQEELELANRLSPASRP